MTWAVLVFAFVGLLGGTHLPDAARDAVVAGAAVVIVVLNVPVAWWLLRRRGTAGGRPVGPIVVGLVVRVVVSASVLVFIRGISHERPPVALDHAAHRRCRGVITTWPDAPAPPCDTLHMCANEAELSAEERSRLDAMVAATPGCEAP